MSSVIKVNLVPRLQAQSDRPPETLHPAAGIHGETSVPGLNCSQSPYKARGGVLIGNGEVDEAESAGHVGPEGPRTGLEFGPKQGGQRTQTRIHKLGGDPSENVLVKLRLKS